MGLMRHSVSRGESSTIIGAIMPILTVLSLVKFFAYRIYFLFSVIVKRKKSRTFKFVRKLVKFVQHIGGKAAHRDFRLAQKSLWVHEGYQILCHLSKGSQEVRQEPEDRKELSNAIKTDGNTSTY